MATPVPDVFAPVLSTFATFSTFDSLLDCARTSAFALASLEAFWQSSRARTAENSTLIIYRSILNKPALTRSKLTMETLEQGVKYVQS